MGLEIAVQHIEAGKPHVAQQLVVKAQQVPALGRAGARAAEALDGVLDEGEGRYFGPVGNVVVVMIFRSIAVELELAAHHIETVEPHVAEQVVI